MIAALILAGCVLAPTGSVYDVDGQRQGTVKESSPGRFDVYDVNGHRLGYGRETASGTVELFDRYSRRIGEIRPGGVPPAPGRSGSRR
jgi:hypothetical protein